MHVIWELLLVLVFVLFLTYQINREGFEVITRSVQKIKDGIVVTEDEKIIRVCTDNKKGDPFVYCGKNGYVSKINADNTYKCCETITGPQGPVGTRGISGKNGEKGLTGPIGNKGPMGLAGPIGPEGPIGDIGPDGEQGPIGLEGEKGQKGKDAVLNETGDAVNIGPTGPMGDVGPPGPMGDPGLPGKSSAQNISTSYHSSIYKDDDQESEGISNIIRRTLQLVSLRRKVQDILPHKHEIEYRDIYTNTPSLSQGIEFTISQ